MSNTEEEKHHLPDGWELVTIADVCSIVRGITFPATVKGNKSFEDNIACLRTTNVQKRVNWDDLIYVPKSYVKSESKLLRVNDILISMANSRELVGKVSFIDHLPTESTFGGFISSVRTFKSLEPKYLFYYLRYDVTQEVLRKTASQTVNIANLSLDEIYAVTIPLAPTNEQRRIVAAIEQQFTRLDAAVEALKQAQKKLKLYRSAVLKAAVEGKLTEDWRVKHPTTEPATTLLKRILQERRAKWEADYLAKMAAKGVVPKDDKWKERYQEPAQPDIEGSPVLPEGWVWVSLGQIAWSVKDGPHYSPRYVNEGIPFITGGNIRPSGVDFNNTKHITAELHEELSKRCKPEKGDILYTKGGTTGIARVNTYDIEFSVWVHVAVLKLVSLIDSFYIQHMLNSPFCYDQAQNFTHGVGNQDLGLTRMINIVLPLAPLTEQEQIVALVEEQLSIISELETTVEHSLKRAERERQGILQEAFAGRLVPQDPEDEPASVLLERIREERKRREEEERRARKQRGSTKMASQRTATNKQRKPLREVLQEAKQPITPDDLFRRAGFQVNDVNDVNDVDEFFWELRKEVINGGIRQIRPDDTHVLLEAVGE